jgi:hypothetical protein
MSCSPVPRPRLDCSLRCVCGVNVRREQELIVIAAHRYGRGCRRRGPRAVRPGKSSSFPDVVAILSPSAAHAIEVGGAVKA